MYDENDEVSFSFYVYLYLPHNLYSHEERLVMHFRLFFYFVAENFKITSNKRKYFWDCDINL